MAKEYFAANNLPFTDYNVGADPEKRSEMVEISGQMGVPVIVIDGKDVIVGFNQKSIESLLGTSS